MSHTDLVHNTSQLEAPAESPAASVSSSDLIGPAKESVGTTLRICSIYFNTLLYFAHSLKQLDTTSLRDQKPVRALKESARCSFCGWELNGYRRMGMLGMSSCFIMFHYMGVSIYGGTQ